MAQITQLIKLRSPDVDQQTFECFLIRHSATLAIIVANSSVLNCQIIETHIIQKILNWVSPNY